MMTVSVIIPVLNEEKYIEECITSLCNQTFPIDQTEWLLIDGDSTDKTIEYAEKCAGKYPLKVLHNSYKKTAYALNMGIENASGKYIIRMDAHACFANDYIEKCVYYLEHTDAENVGGIAETKADGFIGNAIAKMLSTKFGVGNSKFRTCKDSGYVDTVPFGAFRKQLFEKIGDFNAELTRSEDNDINARIRTTGGKIWLSNEIHFTYYCRTSIRNLLKMGIANGNALFLTVKVNSSAMSVRHFIPFIFVLSIIILPLISFIAFFKWIFICECILYILIDIYFSFFNKKPIYGFISIWLYPLFHIAYGIGSLIGLAGIKLY